jgi:integrase
MNSTLVPQENKKRDYINNINQLEPKTGVLFSDFIKNTINRKSKRMGDSYKHNYNTLIYHINNFCIENDVNIYTNSVNEFFLDDFIHYLEEKDLRQNYIKTILSLAKSMTRKAATYGYAVDPTYDEVDIDNYDVYSVFLSMNEITRIYYYQELTKKQQRIGDLFIVGCLTALRYSDYSTLTTENFNKDYIIKNTKKTGKTVIVPLHEYISEIYKKYNGQIYLNLSNQHFNRYIKKICKKIGLNDKVVLNYKKGGKLITETKEKWELISSHTARRSAATNMYLTGRFKTFEIMCITGHTTEKNFFRYIKITNENLVSHIKSDSYFKI